MSDDLRDLLHAAVPEAPPTPDRADGARDRARRTRRRTTVGVVAGSAAVIALVAALPALVSGPAQREEPTPPPSVEPGAFACPGPKARADFDRVPEGAVAVRLCDGGGHGIDAPEDALVTGVDELAQVVNTLPEKDPSWGCDLDLGIGYTLAFQYADGSVVPASGQLYGCRTLIVGQTEHTDPIKPYNAFVRMLRDQRAAAEPPSDLAARPTCERGGFPDSSPVARPAEMVVASLCIRYPTATEHDPVNVPVPEEDLAVLLEDRVRAPAGTEYDPEAPSVSIVGETAWGDRTSRYLDLAPNAWIPGPQAQAVLDRLVPGAGPKPEIDASSTASDVVAAYVDLMNRRDRAGAAALWHRFAGRPDLPTSYARIGYKLESVRPMRFVSAYQDAASVTGLYSVVPEDGSYAEFHTAQFMVGRDEDGVLRIVSLTVGEVVPTGR